VKLAKCATDRTLRANRLVGDLSECSGIPLVAEVEEHDCGRRRELGEVFSRRAREIGDVDGLGHDSITHEMLTVDRPP
jgi:hypothetical protein